MLRNYSIKLATLKSEGFTVSGVALAIPTFQALEIWVENHYFGL